MICVRFDGNIISTSLFKHKTIIYKKSHSLFISAFQLIVYANISTNYNKTKRHVLLQQILIEIRSKLKI